MIKQGGVSLRRKFLRRCLEFSFVPTLAQFGFARCDGEDKGVQLNLVQDYESTHLLDVSPHGDGVALAKWIKGRYADRLQVMGIDSWKEVYSSRFAAEVFAASFFNDGRRLYVATLPFRRGASGEQAIVDLHSGEKHVQARNGIFQALTDPMLLGQNRASKPDASALILAALPGYEEVRRVPSEDRFLTDLYLSSDRSKFVYAVDHAIVCRQVRDLRIVWSARIESGLYGAHNFSLSARGDFVAAAIIDTTVWQNQKHFYVCVYRDDGTQVARLPLNGDQALALSHHATILAIGRRIPGLKGGEIRLDIGLHEVASGRQLATALHCIVPPGRYQDLYGAFGRPQGLQFTPDGKYLVSSGYDRTRIWRVVCG